MHTCSYRGVEFHDVTHQTGAARNDVFTQHNAALHMHTHAYHKPCTLTMHVQIACYPSPLPSLPLFSHLPTGRLLIMVHGIILIVLSVLSPSNLNTSSVCVSLITEEAVSEKINVVEVGESEWGGG